MKTRECEFESEVLSAALEAPWRLGSDEILRAHLQECQVCAEVAQVAGSLAASREGDRAVELPSSGLTWWRAQLRMRREAAAAAERPMIAAQWVAFACSAGLSLWWMAGILTTVDWKGAALAAVDLIVRHEPLIAGMAILLLGAPAIVYLALGKER